MTCRPAPLKGRSPKGMDAAKVHAAYGIGYILSPKDILCITYARKTLYERTPSAA